MLETDKILDSGLRRRTSVSMDGARPILSVETTAPGSDAILAQNQLIQNEGLVQQKQDLHWSLSIPEFDYAIMVQTNPDLESHDFEIKTRAWKKYIASSESRPYRVTG